MWVKVPLFVYEPLIESAVAGATTVAPVSITKFVEDAALLNVFVPAPMKVRFVKAEVLVAVPLIPCAELPLKVVVEVVATR